MIIEENILKTSLYPDVRLGTPSTPQKEAKSDITDTKNLIINSSASIGKRAKNIERVTAPPIEVLR